VQELHHLVIGSAAFHGDVLEMRETVFGIEVEDFLVDYAERIVERKHFLGNGEVGIKGENAGFAGFGTVPEKVGPADVRFFVDEGFVADVILDVGIFRAGEGCKQFCCFFFPEEGYQFPEGENICLSNRALRLRLASTSGMRDDRL